MDVEAALAAAEEAVASGRADLGPSGFWKAVGAVKRRPELVEQYGDRIASIDRAAFSHWALLRIPIVPGTVLAIAATVAGLVVAGFVYSLDAPWNGLFLLASAVILLTATHGLAHLAVGRMVGIRFTDWFVGSMRRPQPGVKVDYASYLGAPARGRAWMHAAGALTTKAIPWLLLGEAWAAGVPGWTWAMLVILGVFMIGTDLALSTRHSDWKRFRREMRYAG